MKFNLYPIENLKSLFALLVLTLSIVAFSPWSNAAEGVKGSNPEVQQTVKKVNLNSASAEDLSEALKGIGMSKAEAIVAYREKNGKFNQVEELLNIKGIGEKTIEKNREKMKL